jgi:NhaP-type Na+/H+ or K+/H+ antiporter
MTVADLAIIAGLVFAWGTLSARLERFDMTAPIVFTVAGVLLTHGPLTPLGITPGSEVVKVLTEATLALVLFSDASRVALRQLRADLGLCLRLLGIGLPLAIGLGTLLAFIGGLAFAAAGGPAARLVPFVEETGTMLSLLVWLMFGVVAVVPALTDLTWQVVLYAVLSLTVIRMLPVAVALAGARLGRPAVLFIGWFGPRGLASVVFGLLALEDLAEPAARPALTVIAFTVLLSVLAHGLTADPLASRYGPRLTPPPGTAPPAGLAEIPERRLIRRSPVVGRPQRGRKPLMTTGQVLPREAPAGASESRPRCPRAGRSAATGGSPRQTALPPGRVREQ